MKFGASAIMMLRIILEMKFMKKYNLIIAVVILSLFSCGKTKSNDNPIPEIKKELPSTYKFLREGKTSVDVSGQWTRIDMHSAIKEVARNAIYKEVTTNELQLMIENSSSPFTRKGFFYSAEVLNNSNKNIWNKISASSSYKVLQEDAYNLIKDLFSDLERLSRLRSNLAKNGQAGVAGRLDALTTDRLVDEKGFEPVEILSKVLMGVLELDQITNHYLSDKKLDVDNHNVVIGKNYTMMEHHWDEAFGYTGLPFDPKVNYSDVSTNLGMKHNRFWAGYLSSVATSKAGKDIREDIYKAFISGRSAIVAKDYKDRNAQRDIIIELLPKACAIRCVHYLREAAIRISNEPGKDWAEAFHYGSEALGFLYALKYTPKSYPKHKELNEFLRKAIDDIKKMGFYEQETPDLLLQKAKELAKIFGFKFEDALAA